MEARLDDRTATEFPTALERDDQVELLAGLETPAPDDRTHPGIVGKAAHGALVRMSAPVRVNLAAPGFVDTPLSASILPEQLENRREQLRSVLPIRRVVGPEDVAALAVHLMVNGAVTGSTYDIDGGQQLVPA